MSYRAEQSARHAQLSAYCAEGNDVARDRMIASIERASAERQQQGAFLLKDIVLPAFVAVVLLKLAGWAFGWNV